MGPDQLFFPCETSTEQESKSQQSEEDADWVPDSDDEFEQPLLPIATSARPQMTNAERTVINGLIRREAAEKKPTRGKPVDFGAVQKQFTELRIAVHKVPDADSEGEDSDDEWQRQRSQRKRPRPKPSGKDEKPPFV
jgi:hypothetical protein